MSALEIEGLVVDYPARPGASRRETPATTATIALPVLGEDAQSDGERARALDDVSLRLEPGERLALVGESGSGKSTLASAIGRLLPSSARLTAERLRVLGRDVPELDREGLRALRREVLGFIPQDPIATLDPTERVGSQLRLVVRELDGPTDRAALRELLEQVQIDEADRVLDACPHELSGGMAQRVAIAIAMARRPAILIADEPTSALDANVRREVLRLIFEIAASNGSAVLWISHDLGAIAGRCDRIAVMRGGRIVEDGAAEQVLRAPRHDYTRHLLESMPTRARAALAARGRDGEEGSPA